MLKTADLNVGDYIQHVNKWESDYGGILCYKITRISQRHSWLTRKQFAVVFGYDASAPMGGSRGDELGRERILFKGGQTTLYNKIEIVNGNYPMVGWYQRPSWPGTSMAIYANGEILYSATGGAGDHLPDCVQ